MARLIYNGVELRLHRTVDFSINPVSNGPDYLYSHVHFAAICVWNPFATADRPYPVDAVGRPLLPPGAAPQGESLGVSIRNLKERLMEKRKYLRLDIGFDKTIEAPQYDLFGLNIECDCNNGPNPLHCQVYHIEGDKTAYVNFQIECWISDCQNVVLSNRWSIRSTTNDQGFTRRIIQGLAVLRADLMRRDNLNADSFRITYFPPVPRQFKRDLVDANLSDDGTQLSYTVVDDEKPLALGNHAGIKKIEAVATAGTQFNITELEMNVAEGIGAGGLARTALVAGISSFFLTPLGTALAAGGYYFGHRALGEVAAARSYISHNRASVIVKVYGDRQAQKSKMASIAVAVGMERLKFTAGADSPRIVSAYISQSVEERYVEFRMEVIPNFSGRLTTAVDGKNVHLLMKMDNPVNGAFNNENLDYKAGDPVEGDGPHLGRVNFASKDARGHWLGALLEQALGVKCLVPDSPPPNTDVQDEEFPY